jgi:hypothetical protein
MIKLETNIKEVVAKLNRFPPMIFMATKRTLAGAANEVAQIMRRPGLPVRYPIQWDSEKQRRAYFATGGFGNGIPYERTGATEQAWENTAIANGYLVSNVGHKAVFVYGSASGIGQSRIHAGRWRLFRPVVDAVVARLPEKILQALKIEIGK